MKRKTARQLMVSLLAGGGVFVLLALGVRWNFWFSALVGVGVYVGLFLLLTPNRTAWPRSLPAARMASR